MYKKQVIEINNDLKRTKKAIISLGCSFVQGQGAVNDELYNDYTWKNIDIGSPLKIQIDNKQQKELLTKYKNLGIAFDSIDFTFMEYDNAFVNVLCKKYFDRKYTPINLGLRGCGNRATIKELYFYPSFNWNELDEIIVIYCPSGPERFDFINDQYNDRHHDHFRWICMWPNKDQSNNASRAKLWDGYAETLWSDKFQVYEQIAHVQELLSWCKLHNAKLIITPGFDRRYDKEYFNSSLKSIVIRNGEEYIKEKMDYNDSISEYLHLFPWDNMFYPEGYKTFADLIMSKDLDLEDKQDYFFQFLGKGSPNMWVTPCAHPSAKAHDYFAKTLFNHIENL